MSSCLHRIGEASNRSRIDARLQRAARGARALVLARRPETTSTIATHGLADGQGRARTRFADPSQR